MIDVEGGYRSQDSDSVEIRANGEWKLELPATEWCEPERKLHLKSNFFGVQGYGLREHYLVAFLNLMDFV